MSVNHGGRSREACRETCGMSLSSTLVAKHSYFESPLPKGRRFLDTVLGSLKLPVTLCLA